MFPAQYIEGMNAPTTLRVLAACLLTAGTTSLPLSARLAAQDTTHIVVVSTTDVHGHASGWDFVEGRPFPGGLTRAATVIDSLRARYPGLAFSFGLAAVARLKPPPDSIASMRFKSASASRSASRACDTFAC